MNGYDEARKIDNILGKLLKENPLDISTKDIDTIEWNKLIRTVESTFNIIKETIKINSIRNTIRNLDNMKKDESHILLELMMVYNLTYLEAVDYWNNYWQWINEQNGEK